MLSLSAISFQEREDQRKAIDTSTRNTLSKVSDAHAAFDDAMRNALSAYLGDIAELEKSLDELDNLRLAAEEEQTDTQNALGDFCKDGYDLDEIKAKLHAYDLLHAVLSHALPAYDMMLLENEPTEIAVEQLLHRYIKVTRGL